MKLIKNSIIIVFITIFFYSCKQQKTIIKTNKEVSEVKTPQEPTFNYFTESEFLSLTDITYDSLKYTFKPTKIYATPVKESKVVKNLGFNEKFVIDQELQKYVNDTLWSTETATGKKTISQVYKKESEKWYRVYDESLHESAIIGYIMEDDLALANFPKDSIMVGKTNSDYTVLLKSYKNKEALDTVSVNFMHGFDLKTLVLNKQKNTNKVVQYRTYRESCPGAEMLQFIAYNSGKFTKLVSGISTGEAGMYEEETIYLPVTDINGKTTLVCNGDIDGYISESMAETIAKDRKAFRFPKNTPINELIIKTREVADAVFDENDNYIELEDGTVKVKVTKEKPKYYKWNGKTFAIIK